MSNSSFDSVETTLRSLREIVDRNHSHSSMETADLVRDMEQLLEEIKTKNKFETKIKQPDTIVPAPLGLNAASVVL